MVQLGCLQCLKLPRYRRLCEQRKWPIRQLRSSFVCSGSVRTRRPKCKARPKLPYLRSKVNQIQLKYSFLLLGSFPPSPTHFPLRALSPPSSNCTKGTKQSKQNTMTHKWRNLRCTTSHYWRMTHIQPKAVYIGHTLLRIREGGSLAPHCIDSDNIKR